MVTSFLSLAGFRFGVNPRKAHATSLKPDEASALSPPNSPSRFLEKDPKASVFKELSTNQDGDSTAPHPSPLKSEKAKQEAKKTNETKENSKNIELQQVRFFHVRRKPAAFLQKSGVSWPKRRGRAPQKAHNKRKQKAKTPKQRAGMGLEEEGEHKDTHTRRASHEIPTLHPTKIRLPVDRPVRPGLVGGL